MHRNAPLTPEGRLRLCQRIEAGWTVAAAAESMNLSRQCATSGGAVTKTRVWPGWWTGRAVPARARIRPQPGWSGGSWRCADPHAGSGPALRDRWSAGLDRASGAGSVMASTGCAGWTDRLAVSSGGSRPTGRASWSTLMSRSWHASRRVAATTSWAVPSPRTGQVWATPTSTRPSTPTPGSPTASSPGTETADNCVAFLNRAVAWFTPKASHRTDPHRQRGRLPLHKMGHTLRRTRASATPAPGPTSPKPTAMMRQPCWWGSDPQTKLASCLLADSSISIKRQRLVNQPDGM